MICSFVCFALMLPSQDPTVESLQKQLQSRGLGQLLETLARARLDDTNLNPKEREQAAINLASSLSQRASRELDAKRRRAGWEESDRIFRPHLQAAVGLDVETFELRLRYGLLLRDRADTTLELIKVLPEDSALTADARQCSEQAAAVLKKIGLELKTRRIQLPENSPQASKMVDLEIVADFHAGMAHLARVLAEPDGAVREGAAEDAKVYFKKNATEFSTLELTLESILGLARLDKALGKFEAAHETMKVFEVHPETPPKYQQQADLLTGQLLLELNQSTAALQKLEVPIEKRVPNSGEWTLALFEALLRAARPDIRGPNQRRNDAMMLLDQLEKSHGAYWKIRGEQVLAKFGDADVIGENSTLLRYVGDLRRRRKEWDDAVKLYDRAAEVEEKGGVGGRESAARLRLLAATSLLEKGDHQKAALKFSEVAEAMAAGYSSPSAGLSTIGADAHLGAAGAIFPLLTKGQPEIRAQYRGHLEKVLGISSASPVSRGEAAFLLGRLCEMEKNSEAALKAYDLVAKEHQRYPAATGAQASLHHDILIISPIGKAAGDAVWDHAVADIERHLKNLDPEHVDTPANKATASWVLALLLAERYPNRLPEAIQLALSEVARRPTASASLRSRAWRGILDWQLRAGDGAAAEKTIDEGFANEESTLVGRLLRLSPLEELLDPKEAAARAHVGRLVSGRILAKSEPVDANAKSYIDVQLLQAQSFVGEKDYSSAARVLGKMRSEAPRDARFARVNAVAQFRSQNYAESLKEWLALSGSARRGSEDWLKLMVEACKCYQLLGKPDRARQLLDYIDANYKSAGSPATREKIRKIRNEVGRQ